MNLINKDKNDGNIISTKIDEDGNIQIEGSN